MRAHIQFFHNLSAAAGRAVPPRTVEGVLRPMLAALDPIDAPNASLQRDLSELGHRMGLTLTEVNPRLDEALAVAQPNRPVLLLIRRGESMQLLFARGAEGSRVTVESLRDDQISSHELPITQVADELDLHDATLVSAWRVTTMGAQPTTAPGLLGSSPLRRLWSFLAPDRTEILLVVGFAVGLGVLSLATPVAVQALVNFVAFGGLIQPLVVLGILLFAFLAFAGAIRVFKTYVVEVLQRRVFVRVVSDLSVRLPRVRVDAYDKSYGPELVNRFFDVMTVQKAGSALLLDGLDAALQASIGLIVLGFYHPFLLVFDIILILCILFVLLVLGRGAVRSAMYESKAKYEVADALEDLARATVTYKLAGAPELARAQLADLSHGYIAKRRAHFHVVFRQVVGAVALHALASTALLTLGGWLVILGQLTLGQLVAAELIVSVALASFAKFGKTLESYYDLMASVDKLGVLYDLPLEDDRGESHNPRHDAASLELRGVSYAYPTHGKPVQGVSLAVEAGEKVAILANRRVGKSTLADLMCGLRDPQQGVVLFDGIDIRDIANDSLRLQMNLVKGLEIVGGTVLDNIRLGRSDVPIEEVRDALARFSILDELLELPDGLATRISTSGAPLSTGTCQLLMLARAIVDDPRVIVVDGILDELDDEALDVAVDALTGPGTNWTLVVLTRRPAIGARFSRIIEFGPRGAATGFRSDEDIAIPEEPDS